VGGYRFVCLRGRPGFRFVTAARSFGLITQTFPTFVAFSRFASISARTRFGVTPSLRAASAVLIIFIGQIITFWKTMVPPPPNFFDK
jgi:hypothetical protein